MLNTKRTLWQKKVQINHKKKAYLENETIELERKQQCGQGNADAPLARQDLDAKEWALGERNESLGERESVDTRDYIEEQNENAQQMEQRVDQFLQNKMNFLH